MFSADCGPWKTATTRSVMWVGGVLALAACGAPGEDGQVEPVPVEPEAPVGNEDSPALVDTGVFDTDVEVPAAYGAWQATVRSVHGAPLADVAVWLDEKLAWTDASGMVRFESVPVGEHAYVAEVDGYSAAAGLAQVAEARTAQAALWMAQAEVAPLADAAAGGSVGGPGAGVQLAFPAEAFTDAKGDPVQGEIQVQVVVVDEPEESLLLPAGGDAITEDGQVQPVNVHVAVEVTPTQHGEEISLEADAVLAVPVAPDDPLLVADAIGLYSFDETQGVWVWEAPAVIENGVVSGVVSHFSWWAFAAISDPKTCASGWLYGQDGQPLSNIALTVASASSVGLVVTYTETDGSFCAPVDMGSAFTITADAEIDGEMYDVYLEGLAGQQPATCGGIGCTSVGAVTAQPVNPPDALEDLDGDGYFAFHPTVSVGFVDCDDADPSVNPGMDEVCDGVDNDCDGVVDDNAEDAVYAWPDMDGDGWGNFSEGGAVCVPPAGWVPVAGDCADDDAAISPDAEEICDDGIDQDCDGADEVCPVDTDLDTAWVDSDSDSDVGDTAWVETDQPSDTGGLDTAPFGPGDDSADSGGFGPGGPGDSGGVIDTDQPWDSDDTGFYGGDTDVYGDTGWTSETGTWTDTDPYGDTGDRSDSGIFGETGVWYDTGWWTSPPVLPVP